MPWRIRPYEGSAERLVDFWDYLSKELIVHVRDLETKNAYRRLDDF